MSTLGWLSWRVYHRGSATFTTGATPLLPPDAYFYSIRAGGIQIGVSSITVDTLTDGVRITERTGLDLPIQLASSRSQYTSQYTLTPDLRLREFNLTFPGTGSPIIQHGTVEGDSVVVITPGTGEPSRRVRVQASALMPPLAATVQLALQQKLRTGTRAQVMTFNPGTLKTELVRLTVLDDSVFTVPDSAELDRAAGAWVPVHSDTLQAWKVEWKSGEQVTMNWVDRYGLPIRVISPSGLESERSAFEIVTINYRQRRTRAQRPGSVIPRTTISSGVIPETGVSAMRVWLSSEGTTWHLPDGDSSGGQSMDGDVVTTRVVGWDSSGPGYQLPGSDTLLPRWQGSEPMLGLEDSTLARQASAILAGTTDPVAATERLVTWVSNRIGRSPESIVWSASTVLHRKQADVDGHTLLFVALARSAGLPARTVSGLLVSGDRLYFHSWAEVYLGRWIAVDPTYGEVPAGAGRVRIAIGTLARPMDLLPLVAGIDVQLLTLEHRP